MLRDLKHEPRDSTNAKYISIGHVSMDEQELTWLASKDELIPIQIDAEVPIVNFDMERDFCAHYSAHLLRVLLL